MKFWFDTYYAEAAECDHVRATATRRLIPTTCMENENGSNDCP